jgi:hypothetical protein
MRKMSWDVATIAKPRCEVKRRNAFRYDGSHGWSDRVHQLSREALTAAIGR